MAKRKLSLVLKSIAIALIACIAVSCQSKSETHIKSKVMKLSSPRGMCSGEQIRAPSGVDYILTAAHCRVLEENGSIAITTEDGRHLQRKVVAEDPYSDLLLLEGVPNMKGLDIADFSPIGGHLRSFTHGRNMDTYKTEGFMIERLRIQVPLKLIDTDEDEKECSRQPKTVVIKTSDWFGESITLCVLDVKEAVTTVPIVPGSSGGPVVNDAGDLAGVVSASDGFFGYLITINDIHNFLRNY